ncbi:HD domain-containing protein [Spiroplasma cantharicola]|uniref:HD superfamily phosphohydrolase n=1 Tax=Spiroplasma cantharicola TaxID=362837 RepID=A0A0M4JJE2_9MOLU|nr:HD domain-containing protein [Spiroplasma cantharicola]ALD66891.1 HD superfamily phosphohydrolase [Spiroplasma cantharicola]
MEKFIRDNVHGEIYLDDKVFSELIDTDEFQRLRRIIQLGGGQFVFPSANHTRFSHCIGVYHVICKFLENEIINKGISSKDKKVVKIAGLLHDIGHGPFSHTFELISTVHHEQYTVEIIRGNTQINKVLINNGIDPQEVVSVIEGKHKNKIVNSLVSSQLDADRLDYLLRDSKGAGVSYSKPDIDWIIRNARIHQKQLVFTNKAINAIENFLLGRYHMFKQVYEHKISIAFDNTFKMWFKRLKDLYISKYKFKALKVIEIFKEVFENKIMPLEKYTNLDDYTMFEIFKIIRDEDDPIVKDLSNRLINRKFLKVSSDISLETIEKMKLDFKGNHTYYFDVATIRNNSIYNQNSEKKEENIYILNNDELSNLKDLSEIINVDWNNNIKKIYIFPMYNVE